jgi:DNA (cytosine-5)-methyltransferase 1
LASAPLPGAAADADRGGFTRIAERDGEQVLGEADDEQRRLDADGCSVDWGRYRPAIQRWERTVARSAPDPREPAPKGGERLSPRFVEWLMGLPAGHVTGVPGLSRNQQLRLLGNGVVPQQGAAALALLLDRMAS